MRYILPRASFIPKGATKVQPKNSDAVAYLYLSGRGRLGAVGFQGKADKPAFNYTFRDEVQRTRYVTHFFEKRSEYLASKAARKVEQQAKPIGLVVGDVLRSMWGYDQTNIDYYEVTRVLGRMVYSPPQLIRPYTIYSRKSITVGLAVGLAGRHPVTDVRVNGAFAASMSNLTYETKSGSPSDTALTVGNKWVWEESPRLRLSNFDLKTDSSQRDELYDQTTTVHGCASRPSRQTQSWQGLQALAR